MLCFLFYSSNQIQMTITDVLTTFVFTFVLNEIITLTLHDFFFNLAHLIVDRSMGCGFDPQPSYRAFVHDVLLTFVRLLNRKCRTMIPGT